jgi:hypothetical protein
MVPEFDNAGMATSAAVVVAASMALFTGWNCFIDLWPAMRRRRAAAENRRVANDCAGKIITAYGPRHDQRRRACLQKRIGEIVFQALSADTGRPPGKKPGATGVGLVAQRKPLTPQVPR